MRPVNGQRLFISCLELGREVYWWFLGHFAAGTVNAYKPIVDLVQHDKPACFSSDSMTGLSPHPGLSPHTGCTLQDGSDHGGVGSSSESDVAVTKVPS